MLAVLVNSVAVVAGACLGVVFRKIIRPQVWESILKVVGIVVIIFGISGVLKNMLYIDENNALQSKHEILLLVILALGTFLGEILKLDYRTERLGERLDSRIIQGKFSEGLISATMIFCIGAMAIIGSVEAGLGDPTTIYLKAAIDGITAIILASTLGYGVAFAAIPLFLYQGLITFLTAQIGTFLAPAFIEGFSLIGYAILVAIGINFLFKSIKPINMTPALLLYIIYYLLFL
ncbi:MAG: DUF554 domain-containing protein [Acholeplasmataceae bacterium]|nr:DUF554 domain-containing protein [Acholeplasmataceae bacterium]